MVNVNRAKRELCNHVWCPQCGNEAKKMFGTTLWVIRLYRNEIIFRKSTKEASLLYWRIAALATESENAANLFQFSHNFKNEILIKWNFLDFDWIKVNVDGSSRSNGQSAGCGSSLCGCCCLEICKEFLSRLISES